MQNNKPVHKGPVTQQGKPEPEGERRIIRIADTDIDSSKELKDALRLIAGIGFSFANAIIKVMGVDGEKKLQDLNGEELDKLKKVMKDPHSAGIPGWMYNWRRDETTGLDYHIIGNELKSKQTLHIQEIKTSRSYRGYRHSFNYKLRGQRVKSRGANFKGRIGTTLGVTKKSAAAPAAKEAAK
jgi:small subunit ribosomal protein S13